MGVFPLTYYVCLVINLEEEELLERLLFLVFVAACVCFKRRYEYRERYEKRETEGIESSNFDIITASLSPICAFK